MVESTLKNLDERMAVLDTKIDNLDSKIETTEDPNMKYITLLDTAEKIRAYEVNRKYNFKEKVLKNLTRLAIVIVSACTTVLPAILQYAV